MPVLLTNAALHDAPGDSILLDGGLIARVGKREVVLGTCAGGTGEIDLGGRRLLPGFNDAHMHIMGLGLTLLCADLSPGSGVTDATALVASLVEWRRHNPTSVWVLGTRFDHNTFPNPMMPGRSELDTAFPDAPVFIRHTSGHAAAANSAALRLAGVGAGTPDPHGGHIVRDAGGEPTGVLLESAAEIVGGCVPAPDDAAMVEAVRRAYRYLASVGVTSASDLGTGDLGMAREIAAFRGASGSGPSPRVTLYPYGFALGGPDAIPDRADFARQFGFPDAIDSGARCRVRLGAMKYLLDGALTTRTAALRTPFADGSGSGMLLVPVEELADHMAAADRAGWQLATHAIGDRAIESLVAVFEKLDAGSPGRCRAMRHRIEHCMLLDGDLIARMSAIGIVASLQMEFLAYLGDAYILGLGIDRASYVNPVRDLLAAGVPVAFGSDDPVVPGAPLDGIRAACSRATRRGTVLGPGQAISEDEAIAAYTSGAAYSVFDEAATGRIRAGLCADLVVLDHGGMGVFATISGGALAYSRDAGLQDAWPEMGGE